MEELYSTANHKHLGKNGHIGKMMQESINKGYACKVQ